MYRISYTADGVISEFLFAFPFFQPADIRVAVNNKIIKDALYSVTPNEDFTGGIVHFVTTPEKGDTVDIFRQVSLSRVIDYQPTAKIDPEHLNSDFNFLLAAFQDINKVNIDIAEWQNTHEKLADLLVYTNQLIQDKMSGGAVLGIYNNLVSVLATAMPNMINDYGSIDEDASSGNGDDYGIL